MKLSAHQPLSFTFLLALHLSSSLSFSLYQASHQADPLPFLHLQVLTDLTDEVTDTSDGDYYQLVAFVNYLRSYNFSDGWLDPFSSDEEDNNLSGLTFHACTPNQAGGKQIMAMYCTLVIANMTQKTYSGQTFVFNLLAANYSLNSANSQLAYWTVPTAITVQNNTNPAKNQTCIGNLTYSFINSDTSKPYNYNFDSLSDLSLQISFKGSNCSVQISTSPLLVNPPNGPPPEVYPYVALMSVVALIQFISCYKLIKTFNNSTAMSRKTSVGTISFMITFDFYIFLVNFEFWTILPNLMLLVVVFFGLLALIIQPITLYFVFKGVRRTNDLNLIMSLFCKLALWLLFTLASAIVSLTYIPNCILYTYSFFLFPQIIDNILTSRKHKWNIWLLVIGLSNLFYTAFVAFDPLKIFDLNLGPKALGGSIGVVILGLVLLKIQTRWPTFGLKPKDIHDYSDLGSPQEKKDAFNDLCSICMEKLDQKPLNGPTTPLLDRTMSSSEILRTPCKHYYHDTCLHEWVKKKLECPNCRQAIPVLGEEGEEQY